MHRRDERQRRSVHGRGRLRHIPPPGFTLLEVLTALLIIGILVNVIVVTYLRAGRANSRAMSALERLLVAIKTMDDLRRRIRRAEAVAARHGPWRSGAETLILRAAGGKTTVFTHRDGALAEIDASRADGKAMLRPLHADAIRFDYGGRAPGEARLVTVTFTLAPVLSLIHI